MVSRGSGSGRREAASTEEPAIPLLCDLCPKKGQFSDISHLLTHISSKGHLSCRFTTDMKAKAGDINAAKKMRDFEKWYAENGIDGLLQDRITSKERRVKKSRGQGGLATTRTARSQPSRHASVKSEPTEDMESMRWEFGPMRLRPTNTGRHSQSVFETPTTRRTRSSAQFPDFDKKIDKFEKWETFETEFSDVTDLIYLDTTEDIYESTVSKLKGIKYPGMAVFDSATPDQRRKRNQRKHESVITNMKRSSEAIEPTECIWQGIGNFERSRDIYATPSVDGSPVSRKAELQGNRKRKKPARLDPDQELTSKRRAKAPVKVGSTRNNSGVSLRSLSTTTMKPISDSFDDDSWDMDNTAPDTGDVFQDDDNSRVINRIVSPVHDTRFQFHRRPALQQLDSNAMMIPPTQTPKHISYPFMGHTSHLRDLRDLRGPINQPDFTLGYMIPPQSADGNSFNPLYMQGRGPAYQQFHGAVYDSTDRTPTTTFQPINGGRYGYQAMQHSNSPVNAAQVCLQHNGDHVDFQL
ncbi:hypothetical protein MGG_09305 [Pyricularia oryzae 70-15]|uniref:Uncharacterized protein n=3 Tax=Pyricularia oryzae TaxID=318829 RepID=G4MQQ6_PYRO7|nr:uncharacterized protein MGG_09305 [Pyricularia oryzae 70-15]EHA57343.1 hypothetical protein MGG_09305 [Pyricularia oryzae 70-15]ELQ40613.1 hypothetical protein OOU_Y34scaffold00414g44 [Pyricularia oryzae Y34]KAI7923209.1 hypothetical protein M9X92_004485 [Pyricularia oryzae]KAI7924132.1 hypothetical protein M0657_004803 [Pyricularia oryzae]